jgi:hypothetical protein
MKMKFLILGVCVSLVCGGVRAATSDVIQEKFHPEPLNVAKAVGDADVLLVADDHTQPAIKNFLGTQLSELHNLGFRSVGIEMLPVRFQADLDTWNTISRQRIQRHLVEFWGEKGPEIPTSIFRLIEEAKRQGFTIIAIDSDGFSDADRRSAAWVQAIERCRWSNKDGSRMIVFGGASHFRSDSGTVLSLLKNQGVCVSVLEFSGLESNDSIDLEWKVAKALRRTVPEATQIARENEQRGRHGLFMVSEAPRCVINLEPQTQVALLETSR